MDWNPDMAAAPRDGTLILAIFGSTLTSVQLCRWMPACPEFGDPVPYWGRGLVSYDATPSAWMRLPPLPAPPTGG